MALLHAALIALLVAVPATAQDQATTHLQQVRELSSSGPSPPPSPETPVAEPIVEFLGTNFIILTVLDAFTDLWSSLEQSTKFLYIAVLQLFYTIFFTPPPPSPPAPPPSPDVPPPASPSPPFSPPPTPPSPPSQPFTLAGVYATCYNSGSSQTTLLAPGASCSHQQADTTISCDGSVSGTGCPNVGQCEVVMGIDSPADWPGSSTQCADQATRISNFNPTFIIDNPFEHQGPIKWDCCQLLSSGDIQCTHNYNGHSGGMWGVSTYTKKSSFTCAGAR